MTLIYPIKLIGDTLTYSLLLVKLCLVILCGLEKDTLMYHSNTLMYPWFQSMIYIKNSKF
jgi:hypothetical protein